MIVFDFTKKAMPKITIGRCLNCGTLMVPFTKVCPKCGGGVVDVDESWKDCYVEQKLSSNEKKLKNKGR